MNYRFSESIRTAIGCVNDLMENNPAARDLYQMSTPPARTNWEILGYFTRIVPTAVEIVAEVPATAQQKALFKIARLVEFYYHDAKVAVIELRGVSTGRKNERWEVARISYSTDAYINLPCLAHIGDPAEPIAAAENWVEYECKTPLIDRIFLKGVLRK